LDIPKIVADTLGGPDTPVGRDERIIIISRFRIVCTARVSGLKPRRRPYGFLSRACQLRRGSPIEFPGISVCSR
jgi:hypothetical protein